MSKRFQIGDRVRLSAEGRKQFPRGGYRPGVVLGYTRNKLFVRVRFDRLSAIQTWHPDLLEVVQTGDMVKGKIAEMLRALLPGR